MRIGALLGMAAGLAACAEVPVAPRAINASPATAEATSFTLTMPYSRQIWIGCANGGVGESVLLAGNIEIHGSTVATDDGGTMATMRFRPSHVMGVGLSTGLVYRGTGASFEKEILLPDGAPNVYTVVDNFRIIGQGPRNNYLVHMVIHQSWNADGEPTADVDLYSNECR